MIDNTPVPGVPMQMSSSDVVAAQSPAITDESGWIRWLVRSSAVVNIESMLPAISFTPIADDAMALLARSPIRIDATRLIDISPFCQQVGSDSRRYIMYQYFNLSDKELWVDTSEWLNSLQTQSGFSTSPQPPNRFPSGPTEFSVPLSSLSVDGSESGPFYGVLRFLGVEQELTANSATLDDAVPMCDDPLLETCPLLPDASWAALKRQLRAEVTAITGFAERVARVLRIPQAKFPYASLGVRAIDQTDALIERLQYRTYICSAPIDGYSLQKFPYSRFEKYFEAMWVRRAPILQRHFSARGLLARRRYARFLRRTFPREIWTLDGEEITGR